MKFKIWQTLWDTTKTQFRGKYIELNVHIRNKNGLSTII